MVQFFVQQRSGSFNFAVLSFQTGTTSARVLVLVSNKLTSVFSCSEDGFALSEPQGEVHNGKPLEP
jgi:hypothetical protein